MKRVVERVATAGAEVGEAPAVEQEQPSPVSQPRRARGSKPLEQTAKEREPQEREFTQATPTASEQGKMSLREILAKAEGGKKPKAETKPAEEPGVEEPADDEEEVPPENDNPDPDAHPPEEGDDETPPVETKAPEKKDGEVEYLTPEQRRDLNAKLSEKRRERELEAELKKAQAETERYKNAKSARELLAAAGHDPAVALEELLVGGGGQPADTAGDMTPREREMAGRLAKLEKMIADSQKTQSQQQTQQLRGGALKRIEETVTAEHFPMVAAMGAFDEVLTEGEGLYDPTEEDGKTYGLRVMQVAADNVEQRLRAKYPAIAAKLAAGEAPTTETKPAAKPKPTVGSRSAPSSKTSTEERNDLPFDESRHAAVKERFFGRAHRN